MSPTCRRGGKTRLCIVNPSQHGGGAELQIGYLVSALRQSQRFEVFYLARHVNDADRADGYTLVRIGNDGRVPFLGYVADLLPLYRALRTIDPHLIYQRVACGYTGICAFYARRRHARMIWHVAHDTDVTPQTLDTGRNFVRRRLEKLSVQYAIPRADCIVAQTHQQGRLLSRFYGREPDAVIANFHPEPSERIDKSGAPLVVWIANLKPWKRPDAFVRLAAALRDVDAQFLMVGDCPWGPRHRAWRDALMQAIGAVPNLRYEGYLPRQEVDALLARATILVNTSTGEGFPNTFIQAWMRDTAVVSLSVDPDDVLKSEGVGIFAGSEQRLASAVRSLLKDPPARAACVARAQRYVRSRHSLRNAEQLVQLIDGLTLPTPRLAYSA